MGAYAEAYQQEELLGLPNIGDANQGQGVSTSQLQNPNVGLTGKGPLASGPPLTQSPAIWIGAILLLVALKLVVEKGGDKSEFSSIRIGFEAWVVVGLLAATFFYAIRTGVNAWPGAPGALKQFVGAI
jgi:hypothetical protein